MKYPLYFYWAAMFLLGCNSDPITVVPEIRPASVVVVKEYPHYNIEDDSFWLERTLDTIRYQANDTIFLGAEDTLEWGYEIYTGDLTIQKNYRGIYQGDQNPKTPTVLQWVDTLIKGKYHSTSDTTKIQ
jgi:hypothetical protein